MSSLLNPMRSDYISTLLRRHVSDSPRVLALIYVCFVVFGIGGSAFLQDIIFGTEAFKQIVIDYANLINFGLVLPTGVFLVFNFYDRIQGCFDDIVDNGVLSFETEQQKTSFFYGIDEHVNKPIYFWIAVVGSICINGLIMMNLHDKNVWNSLQLSIPSVLFRLIAFINMYVMILVLLKSYVVVREITDIFSNQKECSVNISEFHEDGCAGLGSLGRLAVSINYFLGLVAVYLLILSGFKSMHQVSYYDHVFFFPSIIAFVIFSLYLFVSPLYAAHQYVLKWKSERLQSVCRYLVDQDHSVEEPLKVNVDILYYEMRMRRLSKVSTWATDSASLQYFAATILFPFIIAVSIEWLKGVFGPELGL